ncbi:hypothetical protein Q4F19_15555 [Sphingomonas sp. BIUV-7]|uniref:Hemerythrin-like domain-containing protein n=1 Tax=Sphingomonas natans TaxID=3063330 RepID=A0ABT8YBV2_9SPHN|nr:hypothetical protein [Sphingomonas sp. BIUV-7]MDO6415807.1 hypothetical protein [Sphingomonas sp. BIUV-7]
MACSGTGCLRMLMNYASLVAAQLAIDRFVQQLLDLVRARDARPAAAAFTLEMLAAALRDHFAVEDAVVLETIAATKDARHALAAQAAQAEREALKTDWARYQDRWADAQIAVDWSGFSADSIALLGPFRERMNRAAAILYSLALHYDVIGID